MANMLVGVDADNVHTEEGIIKFQELTLFLRMLKQVISTFERGTLLRFTRHVMSPFLTCRVDDKAVVSNRHYSTAVIGPCVLLP